MITYGNVDFEINSLSKTVTINKNDQYGRIVFTGGTIDSWKIVFKNNYSYNESDNSEYDDSEYDGDNELDYDSDIDNIENKIEQKEIISIFLLIIWMMIS